MSQAGWFETIFDTKRHSENKLMYRQATDRDTDSGCLFGYSTRERAEQRLSTKEA